MSLSNPLPKHLRPRREKVFGLTEAFRMTATPVCV
jgi:hypothetical protein